MGKTFAEYQAEHAKEPFPLPMPDGTTIPLKKGSIDEQRAVHDAITAKASQAQDTTPFTGLEVLVGQDKADQIAAAWGTLPPEAWSAVMDDARKHWGEGNSEASPPS